MARKGRVPGFRDYTRYPLSGSHFGAESFALITQNRQTRATVPKKEEDQGTKGEPNK